jgi:hypothetical protein
MKYTTHLRLHSQATRLDERVPQKKQNKEQPKTGLSPSVAAYSKAFRSLPLLGTSSIGYNPVSSQKDTGFKLELFPLHSPLLGESLLVSFPPLNDMLKFSG